MSLVTFDPWRSIESAGTQMKRFFDDFRMTVPLATSFDIGMYSPRIDTSEDEKNFYVNAELPGLTKDDVKISITNGVLRIQGKKERHEEKKGKNFHRVERVFGEFLREFELPDGYKKDGIAATVVDGVLEITIPKNEISKPKETEQVIPISSGRKG